MEISFRISWKRSSSGNFCDVNKVKSKTLQGSGSLRCQSGCLGIISSMSYFCTDFSVVDDWTLGEKQFSYTFDLSQISDKIRIGYSGILTIYGYNIGFNLPTTFSLVKRNDTGKINSSPRAIIAPVTRLQAGCHHTINVAVSDPDGDIIRCRWASGASECSNLCNRFPGAILHPNTCSLTYTATRDDTVRYKAAALMIEDFAPGSDVPYSSVGIQFLILVFASTGNCSSKPEFLLPVYRNQDCIAISNGTTLNFQIMSTNGHLSIKEIQTVSPDGMHKSSLQSSDSNYYINMTWTPKPEQYGQTHIFCYTSINSEGLSSQQRCVHFLPGTDPPRVIPDSNVPNGKSIFPRNTTFTAQFDNLIQRPSKPGMIHFYQAETGGLVYSIDSYRSSEVAFRSGSYIDITPSFSFPEKLSFYIIFDIGVVEGLDGCGPVSEHYFSDPQINATDWTFVIRDVTPPDITFLNVPVPSITNGNMTLVWTSSEHIQSTCQLTALKDNTKANVSCSANMWESTMLEEGDYRFIITATDDEGNSASKSHVFSIDYTPPKTTFTSKPKKITNVNMINIQLHCNDKHGCTFQCTIYLKIVVVRMNHSFSCEPHIQFVAEHIPYKHTYTFEVYATDAAGNIGETVSYEWETDFVAPTLSNMSAITITCGGNISPDVVGKPTVSDDHDTNPVLSYTDQGDSCSIMRTWTVVDTAGNVARTHQHITFEFLLQIALLPIVSLPCDSTQTTHIISTDTATSPNTCKRPLSLTHTDSTNTYACPGQFTRTWTLRDICTDMRTQSTHTITLYNLCESHLCGRNYTVPHGICSFGTCQCIIPWYGDQCQTLIHVPMIRNILDVSLTEGENYHETQLLVQGSLPLTFAFVVAPRGAVIDQLTGDVTWHLAKAGNHTFSVKAQNRVGTFTTTWKVIILTSYSAQLHPIVPDVYNKAQQVLLIGTVAVHSNTLHRRTDGVMPIQVDIEHGGFVRTLRTWSKSDNTFRVIFDPIPTEYGTYKAGARHPALELDKMQTTWKVKGMRTLLPNIQLSDQTVGGFERLFKNVTVLLNDGPLPLPSLTGVVHLLSPISLINVTVFFGSDPKVNSFPTRGRLPINIHVKSATAIHEMFSILISSQEGTVTKLTVNLNIVQKIPILSIKPTSLTCMLVRGSSKVFQFNISNVGQVGASNIRVSLPSLVYFYIISFGSKNIIGNGLDLSPGASALLTLGVRMPSEQALGELSGSISVQSDETSGQIPFHIHVTSDTRVSVTVTVEDEYTYFADGNPLVSDATVTLHNNRRTFKKVMHGSGKPIFVDVPEDQYQLDIKAPHHVPLSLLKIVSLQENNFTVFIERRAVTYVWTVKPVTFENRYEIKLEADFKTHVPIPVVTLTPTTIDLEPYELGILDTIVFNLTNHGLVQADNVGIELPQHPFLVFTAETETMGDLRALSSMIIPVQVSIVKRQKRYFVAAAYTIKILYNYICGDWKLRSCSCHLQKWHTAEDRYPPRGVPLGKSSPIEPKRWRRIVGDGQGGSSIKFIYYSSSSHTPAFCDKCIAALVGLLPEPKISVANCIPTIALGKAPSDLYEVFAFVTCIASIFGSKINPYNLAGIVKVLDHCSGGIGHRKKRSVQVIGKHLAEGMYPIHRSFEVAAEVLGDELWVTKVGDSDWVNKIFYPVIDDGSELGNLISHNELNTMLGRSPPKGATLDETERMLIRLNNTVTSWNDGVLEPISDDDNLASYSSVQTILSDIDIYNVKAVDKGFTSYIDAYNFAANEINQINSWEDEAGVCAVVRILIQQQVALTREAFVATLSIENKEASPLEYVDIKIIITHAHSRHLSTNRFALGTVDLAGALTGIDGAGTLPSEGSGSAEWLIIPYSEAAPTTDTLYNVAGNIFYQLNGVNVSIPLLPTPITVIPDPSLIVHYFWQHHVIGDDPFTDDIEPSEPFMLAVAVKNAGFGTAYNVRIASSQPEIIENEKGLSISFKLIGTNIGTQPITASLNVELGDLSPNTTVIARWWMVSSLEGTFKNYSATFENINPLGDPRLSVLDELEIHNLLKAVSLYLGKEDDGISDFLVNEYNDFPDTVYNSQNLSQYPVLPGMVRSLDLVNMGNGSTSLLLVGSSNVTGWTYFQIEDTLKIIPNSFTHASSIIRNDGMESFEIPTQNVWITVEKRGTSRTRVRLLHIFDYSYESALLEYSIMLCASDCVVPDGPQHIPPQPLQPNNTISGDTSTISFLPSQTTSMVTANTKEINLLTMSPPTTKATGTTLNVLNKYLILSVLVSLLGSKFT